MNFGALHFFAERSSNGGDGLHSQNESDGFLGVAISALCVPSMGTL